MALRIIPLGGLGEIGLNCLVLEEAGTRLVIDCGVMFPHESMFGVDLVIPDFSYLANDRPVDAVLLTHGHEDHIGALPWLLKSLQSPERPLPPLFATPFTRALIAEKLVEHELAGKVDLREVSPSQPFPLGSFEVEFLKVAHSIVDACGIVLATPSGRLVHSGDFKIDPTPPEGEAFDEPGFARQGEAGVALLLSDSTNAERPGHAPSERVLEKALGEVFAGAEGRVFVAMFASHVPRMRQIAALSHRYGRRLLLVGRSKVRNFGLARDLGHLRLPPGLLASEDEAARIPPDKLAVLCTGSQAEPQSALSRMAHGVHPTLAIGRGDTVALSSRMIPGNEREITQLVNQLYRCGAKVHYEALGEIHVSGHAHRDELSRMLELTRPKAFLPVHGEFRHLVHHAELANRAGVAADQARVVENGAILELDPRGLRVMGAAPSGRVFVDMSRIEGMAEDLVEDRLAMARSGLAVVLVVLAADGSRIRGPEVFTRGLATEAREPELTARAAAEAREALASLAPPLRTERTTVEDELRRALRRFFHKELSVKPVVLPLVLTM